MREAEVSKILDWWESLKENAEKLNDRESIREIKNDK